MQTKRNEKNNNNIILYTNLNEVFAHFVHEFTDNKPNANPFRGFKCIYIQNHKVTKMKICINNYCYKKKNNNNNEYLVIPS